MKKIILTALVLVVLTSCRKAIIYGDYFIFGVSYSECEGNCVNYFMIKKEQLYPDNMTNFGEKLKFKNRKLSEDKYKVAKQLVEKFPEFLKNSSSATFGCPDCRDQGAYYIQLKENSKIKKRNIYDFK